jgi:hypothetical protein
LEDLIVPLPKFFCVVAVLSKTDLAMKYRAFVYVNDNPNPIGEVQAESIEKLKNAGRWYAVNYNGRGGRVIIEERNTLRRWTVNS